MGSPSLVEVLLVDGESPKDSWRAEILRRDDGHFQVRLMRWLDEDVPDYGRVASVWSEVHTPISLTDSIEVARSMARDLLRDHAHQAGDQASGEASSTTE